jgi:DNA-binding NtrC family response regulator
MTTPSRIRVLIIERDKGVLAGCRDMLGPDIVVLGATTGEDAERLLSSQSVDALVSDWKLADMHLVDLLGGALERHPHLTLVVPYRYRNHPSLVARVGPGRVLPYVHTPLDPDELRARLTRNPGWKEAFEVSIEAEDGPDRPLPLHGVIESGVPIFVVGDSPCSREAFARRLHRSARCGQPFARIDCAALPEALLRDTLFGRPPGAFPDWADYEERLGLLERADAGTLFLDRIEAMSVALQLELLSVLETGAGELLIVAGSEVNPAKVPTERLRPDLLSRFRVLHV